MKAFAPSAVKWQEQDLRDVKAYAATYGRRGTTSNTLTENLHLTDSSLHIRPYKVINVCLARRYTLPYHTILRDYHSTMPYYTAIHKTILPILFGILFRTYIQPILGQMEDDDTLHSGDPAAETVAEQSVEAVGVEAVPEESSGATEVFLGTSEVTAVGMRARMFSSRKYCSS